MVTTSRAALINRPRYIQKLRSRCLAVVIIEETTKSFSLFHDFCRGVDHLRWNDKAVLQSLMVPLHVVMRYEFSNSFSQGILTKEDHMIQTAFFDATDEAFGVRIQVR